MDTESSINALRRFISRGGRPGEISSDNGGNFVKGKKELREAFAAMERELKFTSICCNMMSSGYSTHPLLLTKEEYGKDVSEL